ncbi:tetratricopeptide repeat protein, partial [Azospirillum sp. TSO5]|uniref:tetratricopeptide repeat protein n=1 Tax=Azospirillum sp. TSO5 TaxID=716760 RepID=UPI0011B1F419
MTADPRSREIRVFLSSTFKDMNAERDDLLKRAFPLVRARCAERGVGFTEIDLRWGVTEEEARNGHTVAICLAEIDRCRGYPPFFIGFLGERYGWIPTYADLAAYWKAHAASSYRAPIEAALRQDISVTELEMRFGVLDRPEMLSHAHFFLRAASLTDALFSAAADVKAVDFYDAAGPRLATLKAALRASGRVALDGYAEVSAFGDRVQALLLEELERRFPADEAQDVFVLRAQAHALFAQARRQGYVPLAGVRDVVAGRLHAHLSGAMRGAVLLRGVSGLGKSALMADLEAWLPDAVGAWMIPHYVGADGLRSLEAWRDGVFARLRRDIADPPELPEDDAQRWDALPVWLDQAHRVTGRPLILLLDALDQFVGADVAIQRLGTLLYPTGTVLLASATPAVDGLAGLALWDVQELRVPDTGEIGAIIAGFAAAYRKTLPPELEARLLAAPQAKVPLYLRLLLEDLRVHGRHETLAARLEENLRQLDAAALFAGLLRQWDRDYGDAAHPAMANRLAALLAASRRGLSEGEMADLLAAPTDPVAIDSGRPRVPKARLAPLLAVLRPYLLRHAGRETLMHGVLAQGALPGAVELATRRHLLEHFRGADGPAVAERVHQRLAILDGGLSNKAADSSMALAEELFDLPATLALHGEDEKLLSRALTRIGAGLADATPETDILIARWKPSLTALGSDDAGRRRLSDLGLWFAEKAYYGIAVNISKDALATYRQVLPPEHPDIARGLNNLALLYQAQGQLFEAQPLYEEALAIFRQALPPKPPVIATGLNNLASLYKDQGRLSEAQPLYEDALAIFRQSLPPRHPDIAVSLNNLALLYQAQGRLPEAQPLYEEALAIYRQARPPGHPDIANGLSSLASLYQAQGQLSEAQPL